MSTVGLKFGLGPRKAFLLKCGQGLEREGINVLVFEKKLLNVLVSLTPNSPICIATSPKLCVWLPADVTLQRLAAVLAGYGVELRQLTPEQLSTLSTLLQLLPKGSGRNLGECPDRETSTYQLHEGFLLHLSRPQGAA